MQSQITAAIQSKGLSLTPDGGVGCDGTRSGIELIDIKRLGLQVDGFTQFLTSGVAASGHAARIAALAFCLRYQDKPWEA
jgi:hypothetical protein